MMRVDIEFDTSDKMDQSPNSVLPTLYHFPDAENRNAKLSVTRRDEILKVKEGFSEISFRRYRSLSCKDNPSKAATNVNRTEPKRGSIYQNSREVDEMRKLGRVEGGKNIELSRVTDASFSFRIVDSMCVSDKKAQQRRSLLLHGSSKPDLAPADKSSTQPNLSDDFIDICLNSGIKERKPAEDLNEEPSVRFDEAAGHLDDSNDLIRRDSGLRFQKSHSLKVEMRKLLFSQETDSSTSTSSRVQFSPMKRMFDPFFKSKSLRSPLSYVSSDGMEIGGKENLKCNDTSRKQLSTDLKPVVQNSVPRVDETHNNHAEVKSSPVYLHAQLKLENRNGMPVFEFSLDCPEDAYAAKSWRTNNGSNWVYTFHSIGTRKKSNASLRGLNENGKDPLIVGQMQVSYYISTEIRDGLESGKSMVTEFVLYDIAHARRSISNREALAHALDASTSLKGSKHEPDLERCKTHQVSNAVKNKVQSKHKFENCQFESLVESSPWTALDCSTDLQIAAIVIQDPIEKRESLRYKRGNKVADKRSLLNISIAEECEKELCSSKSPERLKVVIPTGTHSLPSTENSYPSPLLQRWRAGGGCDCGGWDMACPLIILGNPNIKCGEDQPLVDTSHPLELFVQGARHITPALAMTFLREGQYAVDFHAQLSTLQAFSICVAILHGAGASGTSNDKMSVHFPRCDSLTMLIGDEVRHLVEAVIQGEEKKKREIKAAKTLQSSYMPNPPFSPIARV